MHPRFVAGDPVMVICDGCFAHTVDNELKVFATMVILRVILPLHHTHALQGEDLYPFGVLKDV